MQFIKLVSSIKKNFGFTRQLVIREAKDLQKFKKLSS